MSKTTNKFFPEARARAGRMVLDREGNIPLAGLRCHRSSAKIGCSALDAGDDFNALNGIRHRRMPRLEPRAPWLRQESSRIGG
jgi:hypothetical protein